MKNLILMIGSGALLFSCSTHPLFSDQITHDVSVERGAVTERSLAKKGHYSGQVSPCALSGLNLTNDPCNALHWQNYVEVVVEMNAAERYDERERLGDSDVEQLKKLILDVHLATQLTQRQQSANALEQAIENYSVSLQPLLTSVVSYNEMLNEHKAELERTKAKLDQQSKALMNTQEALRLAQEKIDAITNIEQQLNSEGALGNDDEQ